MTSRLWSTALILAWLLFPSAATAQQDPATRWECAVGGGFLIPHRTLIRHHIQGHAASMQWTWSRRGLGLWGCAREAPRWGVSVRLNGTGAPEAAGKQVHLLGMAELRISSRWRFRMAGGMGWTQRHWAADSPEARQHVIIGSALNSAIEIGLHRPATCSATHWHDRVGVHLCLSHQSNASVSLPNLGTNVATLALSTAWPRAPRPKRSPPADTMAVLSILPAPVQGWAVSVGIGGRQPAPTAARESVAELGVDWRRGGLRGGLILGGLAFQRNQTASAGLHAGFQIRFTRVQIDAVHGRYLSRLQPDEAAYNRVVFQAHVRSGLWCRIGLHTHGFRAHHPILGVGWALSGQTPYGARRY